MRSGRTNRVVSIVDQWGLEREYTRQRASVGGLVVLIIALEAERAVGSRGVVDHLVEGLRWDYVYRKILQVWQGKCTGVGRCKESFAVYAYLPGSTKHHTNMQGDVLRDKYNIAVAKKIKQECRDTQSKTRRSGCRRQVMYQQCQKLLPLTVKRRNQVNIKITQYNKANRLFNNIIVTVFFMFYLILRKLYVLNFFSIRRNIITKSIPSICPF